MSDPVEQVTTPEAQAALLAMQERHDRVIRPIIDALLAEDPGMPVPTAFVIAQDLASIERAEEHLAAGEPWLKVASVWVGSYGRLEWIKRLCLTGRLQAAEVFPHIVELWSGADPDDTDPFWLGMWQEAKARNGGRHLTDDGIDIPLNPTMTVFRGQPYMAKVGIAWTLDRKVASKFARTGGGRWQRPDGVVLVGQVFATDVYAYITGRGESEIISDRVVIAGREALYGAPSA
jgi:hypothetical protein